MRFFNPRSHSDIEESCISKRPIIRGRGVREEGRFGSSCCPLSTYDIDHFDRVCHSTISTKSFLQLVLSRHNNVLMLDFDCRLLMPCSSPPCSFRISISDGLCISTDAASDSVCSPRVHAMQSPVQHFAVLGHVHIPSNGPPRRRLVLPTRHTFHVIRHKSRTRSSDRPPRS